MAGERVVGPFNPTATCPKCGGSEIGAHWTEVGKHRRDHDCLLDGEHIHRTCRRCWFGWVETPLDLAAAPPAPPAGLLSDEAHRLLDEEVARWDRSAAPAGERASDTLAPPHTDAVPCPGCVWLVANAPDGCNDPGEMADWWHAQAMKAAGRAPQGGKP